MSSGFEGAPTPGPWAPEKYSSGCGHINVTGPRLLPRPRFGPVAAAYANLAGPMDEACVAEMKANASLIAEAGTVLHETGLTPRQLAEERAELLEALQNAVAYGLPVEISDAAVTALANATQQRKEPGA